jgi:SAM-dependent methyltransferase
VSGRSYRRRDCRLCGSTDLTLVIPLAPTPVADDFVPASRLDRPQEVFPLDAFLCNGCGLVQLLEVVDPNSIYEEFLYVTRSSPGLVEHFQGYADDVVQRTKLGPGRLVVEIGSNDGTLISFFQRHGLRVLGIDPAKAIAMAATAAGTETIAAGFTPALAAQIKHDRGAADLIVANNVVANIDDLQELAGAVRDLLAPDGVFVIESGYLADLVRNLVFDNIYHEHLCYHSVKPLAAYLARHGMEMFDVQHVPTKGGSIRVFAQHRGAARPVTPNVAAMIAAEEAQGLYRPETYQALCRTLDRLRDSLVDVLCGLKMRGRSIAGYGASHSVTTLIHHFGIADQLSFVVDDNPLKHNLHSPGNHLPVLPSAALLERRPDYVVVMPWRFAEAITRRNQPYLQAGGRFIVPIPETRIL